MCNSETLDSVKYLTFEDVNMYTQGIMNVLRMAGILRTKKLDKHAKDIFRRTNWDEKINDVSPWQPGWFGRAYIASMYSNFGKCMDYVRHKVTAMHGLVPTGVNVIANDGMAEDPEQFGKVRGVQQCCD